MGFSDSHPITRASEATLVYQDHQGASYLRIDVAVFQISIRDVCPFIHYYDVTVEVTASLGPLQAGTWRESFPTYDRLQAFFTGLQAMASFHVHEQHLQLPVIPPEYRA